MKSIDYLKKAYRAVRDFYLNGWLKMDDDDVISPRTAPSELEQLGIGAPSVEDVRKMSEIHLMKEDIGEYLACLDSEGLEELLKLMREENGRRDTTLPSKG